MSTYDFYVKKAEITSSHGGTLDISAYIQEYNIYEDVFNYTLYGNLVLLLSTNLLEALPIIGREKFDLTFGNTDGGEIDLEFLVYKVGERTKLKNNTETCILHLTSIESYLNESTVINRRFRGGHFENIANKILQKMGSTKGVSFAQADSVSNLPIAPFIACNWHPFQCIAYMLQENYGNNVLFYETLDGFFETTAIDTLSTSPGSYYFLPQNYFKDSEGRTVGSYNIKSTFDSLKYLDSGSLGTDTVAFNTLAHYFHKNFRAVDSGIESGGFPKYLEYFNAISQRSSEKTKVYLDSESSNKLQSISYPGDGTVGTEHNTDAILFRRNIAKAMAYQSTDMVIEVMFTGKPNIMAATLVDFNIPDAARGTGEDSENGIFNGKYFCTSVRHSINKQSGYRTFGELVKFSMQTKDGSSPYITKAGGVAATPRTTFGITNTPSYPYETNNHRIVLAGQHSVTTNPYAELEEDDDTPTYPGSQPLN